jgi:hypothetical protein
MGARAAEQYEHEEKEAPHAFEALPIFRLRSALHRIRSSLSGCLHAH